MGRVHGGARLPVRFANLGLAVACGGVLYVSLEPACLAGPFGQVGAALGPIWLDHVLETKSILWFAASHPAAALAVAAFLCAGAAAQVALWVKQPDTSRALAAAFVVLAVALGLWQVKLLALCLLARRRADRRLVGRAPRHGARFPRQS